jgi:hypothetical protein
VTLETSRKPGGLPITSHNVCYHHSAKLSLIWLGFSKCQYVCPRCSHLQFAVDFSEDDLKQYQRFEGEQQRSASEAERAYTGETTRLSSD